MVVRTDDAEWFEFPVGAVEFLTGGYGRTTDVPGTPGDFPGGSAKILGLIDRSAAGRDARPRPGRAVRAGGVRR